MKLNDLSQWGWDRSDTTSGFVALVVSFLFVALVLILYWIYLGLVTVAMWLVFGPPTLFIKLYYLIKSTNK